MRYVTDDQYDEQYAIPETDEERDEQSAEERQARIAYQSAELRSKAEYVDLIDAIDSASAELGQPFVAELEMVLRGDNKEAIGFSYRFCITSVLQESGGVNED
jgi:hypothetical protein